MAWRPGLSPRWRYLAALTLLWAGALAGAAEPFKVGVILSEEGGAYADVGAAIRTALARENAQRYRVSVVSAGADAGFDAQGYAIVVTVGMKAANAVQQARVPVLYTLAPKGAIDKLVAGGRGAAARTDAGAGFPRSGIYLDQPLERQLELVRLVIPAATRIGVVYGPDSVGVASALENAAASLGMKVEAEAVSGSAQVTSALPKVLERSDALLGLPDPEVFNRDTVHNLLLTAYRAGDAVFAFSPAYVKAGALAGVFSTSAQIGTQAAEIVAKFLAGAGLPEPQYPKYFSVTVNRTVARSMRIPIDEERDLQQKLQNLAEAGG